MVAFPFECASCRSSHLSVCLSVCVCVCVCVSPIGGPLPTRPRLRLCLHVGSLTGAARRLPDGGTTRGATASTPRRGWPSGHKSRRGVPRFARQTMHGKGAMHCDRQLTAMDSAADALSFAHWDCPSHRRRQRALSSASLCTVLMALHGQLLSWTCPSSRPAEPAPPSPLHSTRAAWRRPTLGGSRPAPPACRPLSHCQCQCLAHPHPQTHNWRHERTWRCRHRCAGRHRLFTCEQ